MIDWSSYPADREDDPDYRRAWVDGYRAAQQHEASLRDSEEG
jgi:hypothetical protein